MKQHTICSDDLARVRAELSDSLFTQYMPTKEQTHVDGLTFEEYCNDAERVRADAIAAGVKGAPSKRYHMTDGRYNGKTSVTYAKLDNLELYNFAKQRFGRE